MVFNHAARLLFMKAGADVQVVTHDWWAYQLVSGADGEVFYDKFPSLLYRQHENNLVGMNVSWKARLKRLHMLWQGRFRSWNAENIRALRANSHLIASDSLNTLSHFEKAREMSFIQRILEVKRSGVYRQTLLGNLGLLFAVAFKKA